MLLKNETTDHRELAWNRWVLQSARVWGDVSGIVQGIGIYAVDEDHRKFTQYALDLNIIIDSLNKRESSIESLSQGAKIFEKLVDYAQVHFEREKRIMLSLKAPMLEPHLEQHAIFMEMINKHYADFKRGRLQMISGLKLSILDWWIDHINVMDYNTFTPGLEQRKKQREKRREQQREQKLRLQRAQQLKQQAQKQKTTLTREQMLELKKKQLIKQKREQQAKQQREQQVKQQRAQQTNPQPKQTDQQTRQNTVPAAKTGKSS